MADTVRAVLCDLDGVLRLYDSARTDEVEMRHGLARGSIEAVAFEEERLQAVTTGSLRRSNWITEVGQLIGSPAAASEWGARPVRVNHAMLNLIDELAAHQVVPCLITNGTDELRDEIAALGIAPHFEHVFNSWSLRMSKPDLRIYRHALQVLELEAHDVIYVDDTRQNVDAAASLGIKSHLFTDAESMRMWLNDSES